MTTPPAPALDRYWAILRAALPTFSAAEQRAAVILYRELARGEPVSMDQLAGALGTSVAEANSILGRDTLRPMVYPDAAGRVVGFGGLATVAMHHRFEVGPRTLWTWCAWDSLFLPQILDVTAQVESPDPESGHVVRLTVSPQRIETVRPERTFMSFLLPEAARFRTTAGDVMAGFCHFVFLFASRTSGERWVRRHPATFLYTLDEAADLARRFTAAQFGAVLSAGQLVHCPRVGASGE